jgi:hypothetical protein
MLLIEESAALFDVFPLSSLQKLGQFVAEVPWSHNRRTFAEGEGVISDLLTVQKACLEIDAEWALFLSA